MPQSLSLNIIHLIFSTKDRHPFLTSDFRPGLHAYLATIARGNDGECFRVGGIENHVHLAIRLPRTIALSSLVNELKSSSSRWIKSQSPSLHSFAWQRGYAAYSVGPKQLDALVEYIDNQEEHHRKKSFEEEYRSFLNQYGVDYDEQYVWD